MATCRRNASSRSRAGQAPTPPLDGDLVFSSLPGAHRAKRKEGFAEAGYPVISNSSAFRMDEDVPLLIPEVNHEHLGLLELQRRRYPSGGYIVTNPNCSTIMIVMALAPLQTAFRFLKQWRRRCRALSGAELSGVGFTGHH